MEKPDFSAAQALRPHLAAFFIIVIRFRPEARRKTNASNEIIFNFPLDSLFSPDRRNEKKKHRLKLVCHSAS